jgi:hypothetical protein
VTWLDAYRQITERDNQIQRLSQDNAELVEKTEFLQHQLEQEGTHKRDAAGAARDHRLTITFSKPILYLLWTALAVATVGAAASQPGILV